MKQEAGLRSTKPFRFLAAAMLAISALHAFAQIGTHLPPQRPIGSSRDKLNPNAPISLTGQIQEQLDQLEGDLRITAAQRPLWNAYADRVRKLAEDIARARFLTRTKDAEEMPASQQLERVGDVARNRLTAVEDIVDAGKALYKALAPDQQRTADRRLVAVALQLAASGTAPPDTAAVESGRQR